MVVEKIGSEYINERSCDCGLKRGAGITGETVCFWIIQKKGRRVVERKGT